LALRASWGPRQRSMTVPEEILPVAARPSSPLGREATFSITCRVFRCGMCGSEVIICRRCDRGHRYCSQECSGEARRASLRRAGAKYRKTERGRTNHKVRQQRYLERQSERVTHQGSLFAEPVGEMERDLAGESTEIHECEVKGPEDEEAAEEEVEESCDVESTEATEEADEGASCEETVVERKEKAGFRRCTFCGRLYLFEGRRDFARRRGGVGHSRSPPRGSAGGASASLEN